MSRVGRSITCYIIYSFADASSGQRRVCRRPWAHGYRLYHGTEWLTSTRKVGRNESLTIPTLARQYLCYCCCTLELRGPSEEQGRDIITVQVTVISAMKWLLIACRVDWTWGYEKRLSKNRLAPMCLCKNRLSSTVGSGQHVLLAVVVPETHSKTNPSRPVPVLDFHPSSTFAFHHSSRYNHHRSLYILGYTFTHVHHLACHSFPSHAGCFLGLTSNGIP